MTMTNSGRRMRAGMLAVSLGTLIVAPHPLMSQAAPVVTKNVRFGPDQRLGDSKDFGPTTEQTEPAIAVNPVNEKNLVAGFHDSSSKFLTTSVCHVAFSSDGGTSWSSGGSVPLQSPQNQCFDSSLVADLNGVFYYTHLDVNTVAGVPSGITLARSTDGGRSFPTFSVVTLEDASHFVDKPYMAIDIQARSKFRGTLYVAYANFTVANSVITSNSIRVVSSQDGGITWSDPRIIATSFSTIELEGPVPVVAPDGTVYVFYQASKLFVGGLSIQFAKSVDGGQTWSAPGNVAANLPSPGFFLLKNADPTFGNSGSAGLKATSIPTAAIAPDGTIYVAWADFPQGSCVQTRSFSGFTPCVNADVRLAVSRDGGKSWSGSVKVSDETNATDQFMPWIATHPDGLLSIVWLDKRLDPSNENFDAFYTNTYDGMHFLPNKRVSTATSIIGKTEFIGDYQGIAATPDGVFPVWNDVRTGNPAVFTAVGQFIP